MISDTHIYDNRRREIAPGVKRLDHRVHTPGVHVIVACLCETLQASQDPSRWVEQLDAEIRSGFENFRHLTTQIDCDAYDGGHLYLAHRPEKLAGLGADFDISSAK